MCIVYGLRAADSNLYFYVGSTKFSAEQRLNQHLDTIRRGNNTNRHLVNKVAQVGQDNVVVDVLVECTADERFEIEYQWVNDLRALGHPLTNIVHSGDMYVSVRKAVEDYDEFILRPNHFTTMLDAHLFGLPRTGNKLADAICTEIEQAAETLLTRGFSEFMTMFKESLAIASDGSKTDRQAASVHQRIFDLLERS